MLKLYNTYSGKKEIFRPVRGKKVGIYTCGPTVYNYIHIGNLRAFLTADVLKRHLEYKGYRVYHIKNITDVGHMVSDADEGEDKVIKTAKKEGKTPYEVARFYEEAFKQDEELLNIEKASVYPRATDFIQEMIKITKELIRRGYAYKKNGSVYFDISKFSRYGRLSGNTLEKLEVGTRIACHKDKKHPHDFALWKKAEKNRLMKWESPWGKGFPGWHVECSAMSQKYIGDTIDVHTGGEDNIFPHHEDEIAQSESLTDKKFVNYWLHTRHLLVDGKKMAKSDGNFYTVKDLVEKGFNPLALRYLFLTSHHRDPLNFTVKSLKASELALDNLDNFIFMLNNGKFQNKKASSKIITATKKMVYSFEKYMDDDLNTPKALAGTFEYTNLINKEIKDGNFSKKDQALAKKTLKNIDKVFGIIEKTGEDLKLSGDIKMLIEERERARKNKDWAHSDALRDQIEEDGYIIEDTPWGTHIKRKTAF